MLNLPEIMPIKTVLAMAKIPRDTNHESCVPAVPSRLPSPLQNLPEIKEIESVSEMVKLKSGSSPKNPHRHRYQLRQRHKRHDQAIASDNTSGCLHPQPEQDNSCKSMVEPNVDTVKTAETAQQKLKSAGPALLKMPRQRQSRRAKPCASSPLNKKTNMQKTNVNNDETSRIKIRLKGGKIDPAANVKVIINGGNAEQPACSEPKPKMKMDPQGGLQQRKVRSNVLSNMLPKPIIFTAATDV